MVEDRWLACRETLEETEVSGDGVNGGVCKSSSSCSGSGCVWPSLHLVVIVQRYYAAMHVWLSSRGVLCICGCCLTVSLCVCGCRCTGVLSVVVVVMQGLGSHVVIVLWGLGAHTVIAVWGHCAH